MLFSLALILLIGLAASYLLQKAGLPGLLGMLLTGILLGPYGLNLIHPSLIGISADIRKIALVIILTRAGLALNLQDLQKIGRPAFLLCFLPACFEILGIVLLAPKLLSISTLEAAVLGSVIAAVSPAVIVPKMLKLIEEGYGRDKSIPQLILAGASVDDVFVIVLFTAFTSLAKGQQLSALYFLQIPLAILTGILAGFLWGLILSIIFRKIHVRDSVKVLLLLSFAFLFTSLEDMLEGIFPFSGLLAIMAAGVMLFHRYPLLAKRLALKFSKLWVFSEILLFVLVGALVNPAYLLSAGPVMLFILFAALLFRMAGVFLSLSGSDLQTGEKFFSMIAYSPKATVQAAIGGIPLAMGLACGDIVLTGAVLAILLTAPLGAFFIDISYKKLLNKACMTDCK